MGFTLLEFVDVVGLSGYRERFPGTVTMLCGAIAARDTIAARGAIALRAFG